MGLRKILRGMMPNGILPPDPHLEEAHRYAQEVLQRVDARNAKRTAERAEVQKRNTEQRKRTTDTIVMLEQDQRALAAELKVRVRGGGHGRDPTAG